MSSYTTDSPPLYTTRLETAPNPISGLLPWSRHWRVFGAAVFLVAVPVFFQAPLVRSQPWVSLLLTGGWLGLSLALLWRPRWHLWGDLLFGFTWTWLAGSLYWGWLRWEPFLHLPIEAVGLPFAFWCIARQWGKVGNYFYLGSLLGTALTDVYFYLVRLIPHWRQLMQVEPDALQPIFQNALLQVRTLWGVGCAAVLVALLLMIGMLALRSRHLHWWAFGGAVLSTLLVDSLFLLVAVVA